MGNCTNPEHVEGEKVPLGSLGKNASLRSSQAEGQPYLDPLATNMRVNLHIYSKCEGLVAPSVGPDPAVLDSTSSFQTEDLQGAPTPTGSMLQSQARGATPTQSSLAQKAQERYLLNYTLRYGGNEHIWVEHNCEKLHKSRCFPLQYQLG